MRPGRDSKKNLRSNPVTGGDPRVERRAEEVVDHDVAGDHGRSAGSSPAPPMDEPREREAEDGDDRQQRFEVVLDPRQRKQARSLDQSEDGEGDEHRQQSVELVAELGAVLQRQTLDDAAREEDEEASLEDQPAEVDQHRVDGGQHRAEEALPIGVGPGQQRAVVERHAEVQEVGDQWDRDHRRERRAGGLPDAAVRSHLGSHPSLPSAIGVPASQPGRVRRGSVPAAAGSGAQSRSRGPA
jgi:hypothetical protein